MHECQHRVKFTWPFIYMCTIAAIFAAANTINRVIAQDNSQQMAPPKEGKQAQSEQDGQSIRIPGLLDIQIPGASSGGKTGTTIKIPGILDINLGHDGKGVGNTSIKAPFVDVNVKDGHPNVKAPFVDVAPDDSKSGVSVKAPLVNVEPNASKTGISVKAPFTQVDTSPDRKGASVKAPFVDVESKPSR